MKIVIGQGSCGIAAGAQKVFSVIEEKLKAANSACALNITGCIGMCYLEPIVEVHCDNGDKYTFVNVDEASAAAIADKLLDGGIPSDGVISSEDAAVLSRQERIALRNCGNINPESIDEYIATGGYEAIRKCVSAMTREQVIDEIRKAGLRGRGGAGFPTAFKWNAALKSSGDKKYIVCNADEGDPGAFMDRSIMEGDPHNLIESMAIGGYAIGANEGVIYVRAEYPLAIRRLKLAIEQAKERGFLGDSAFDGKFKFDMRIKAGAGAFVCGEETALIASLEGERGMPRLKPPFPAEKGYWQKPTNINNVETLSCVAWIIRNGGQAFTEIGTKTSSGTKVFALTGKIRKGGLVEVPMGTPLREIIYDIGGGIRDRRELKAVQMGGPSGGCIPADLIDTPVEYESIVKTGAIMGSGGMVVMDDTTCMVDMARFFLDFTRRESCGKCTHCRIGTKRMLEILERICAGNGRDGDIELLIELGNDIKDAALCGLGMSAPNPVLTTIKYFRHEYEEHINSGKCRAKQCSALLTYGIISENCSGCGACSRKCPVGAITGEKKTPHVLDADKCVKCGICATTCKFDAVSVN